MENKPNMSKPEDSVPKESLKSQEKVTIETLKNDEGLGKTYTVVAKVVSVRETKGPTLFRLEDNTGSIMTAAFQGRGIRAFPEINRGDVIVAQILKGWDEKKNIPSFVLVGAEKASKEEAEKFLEELEKGKESVKNEIMASVVGGCEGKKAELLRKSISVLLECVEKNKMFVVKYHLDLDGVASALLFGKLVEIMSKKLKVKSPQIRFFGMRKPSYTIEDALLDMQSLGGEAENTVLVILDNGSTKDDVDALKLARADGFKVVVVDHHPPDENVEDVVNSVLNPYLWGGDKNENTALILYEMLELVNNPDEHDLLICALAVIADKSKGERAEEIVEKAKEVWGEEFVEKVRWVLDYVITVLNTRLDVLFVERMLRDERFKEMVDVLYPTISSMIESRMGEMSSSLEVVEGKDIVVAFSELKGKGWQYPPAGRSTGLLFEKLKEEKGKSVALFCFVGENVIVRVDEGKASEFFAKDVLGNMLKEEIEGIAEPGGHDVAYSFRAEEEMHEKIKEAVKKRVAEG